MQLVCVCVCIPSPLPPFTAPPTFPPPLIPIPGLLPVPLPTHCRTSDDAAKPDECICSSNGTRNVNLKGNGIRRGKRLQDVSTRGRVG